MADEAEGGKGAEKNRRLVSYRLKSSAGKTEITVTSGKLTGKSAIVITSPPSAAYFNDAPRRAVIIFESPEIKPETFRLRDGDPSVVEKLNLNHVSESRKRFTTACFLMLRELAGIIDLLDSHTQYLGEALAAYDKPPP